MILKETLDLVYNVAGGDVSVCLFGTFYFVVLTLAL